ncbi:MAG TPA: TetR/AcrR family transcriptional regulator [Candidatus Baltobacteraceae bacterium]|nr:TetR/AcrR family transcriptional regulator [Candidatus Baltobacteraceae bacterium]
MAYEVIKTIGSHRYRYSVESYREPETGKVKNRWTYLGRADSEVEAAASKRSSREERRDAFAAAFLRLVERKALDEVTPAAIAREAKLSSATFYRHFRSRDELVAFCTQRAMNDLNARLAELKAIAPSAQEERKRLRALAVDLVRRPSAPPALFRAWSVLSPEKVREERHTRRIKAFGEYIEELVRRTYIQPPEHVRGLAIALSMIVQSFTRRSVIESRLLSEEDYAVVADTFTRLVFLSP